MPKQWNMTGYCPNVETLTSNAKRKVGGARGHPSNTSIDNSTGHAQLRKLVVITSIRKGIPEMIMTWAGLRGMGRQYLHRHGPARHCET